MRRLAFHRESLCLCNRGSLVVFDDYFLSIPVYRVPEEKYYSEMEKDFNRVLSDTWEEDFIASHPDLVDGYRSNHRDTYGGDWEFNEIIGFIKLFFMGTQVRGEYWSTKPKRKVKTRKKDFEFKTHKIVAECEIRQKTNVYILRAIEEYLTRSKQYLKNRHIDLREFEALKDHIDWVSVLEAKNTIA